MDTEDKLMLGSIAAFVALAAIALGLWVWSDYAYAGTRRANAETQARAWLAEMYPNREARVLCQSADTDSNGYITCTVRIGTEAAQAIECAEYVWWTHNRGCRPARMTLPTAAGGGQ